MVLHNYFLVHASPKGPVSQVENLCAGITLLKKNVFFKVYTHSWLTVQVFIISILNLSVSLV